MKQPKSEAEAELLGLAQKWNQDAAAIRERLRSKPAPKKPADKEKKKRGPRGAGSVYQNKGTKLWTLQYKGPNGKRVHEPTGTTLKGEAVAMLAVAVAAKFESGEGKARSVEGVGWRWKHLGPAFGDMRASEVKKTTVDAYKKKRRREKTRFGKHTTTATINREIACLRRMFNLGLENERIDSKPAFKTDKENNRRTGYLKDWEYDRLTAAAKHTWLRALLEVSTAYGFRRSELLGLRFEDLDFDDGVIFLHDTKNGEPRTVPMTPKVEALLAACVDGKKAGDAVFTWGKGRYQGQPVADFRVAWRKLFEDAGVPLKKLHDMRRTAARNLSDAGVPETVIMEIGGWKANGMFKRYNIVDLKNQRDAFARLEQHRKNRREQAQATDKPLLSPGGENSESAAPPQIN